MTDPFSNPGNGYRGTRTEVRRTKDGRPYVFSFEKGKETPYTRWTSFIDCLDDKTNLARWGERMMLEGLCADGSSLFAELTGGEPEDVERKAFLTDLAQRCKEAAGYKDSANYGTDVHGLTELFDAGEPMPDAPAGMLADVAAYGEALKRYRLVPREIEVFVCHDGLKAAGTFDRVYDWFRDGWDEPPLRVVGDLKGLSLDTPIPTPSGWTTMGAVEVGDEVFDAYGKPTTVTSKSRTKNIGTYVVTFDDASKIVCDVEHIWWTQAGKPDLDETPTAKSITEIIDTLHRNGQSHHRVPVAGALDLPDAELPIDPYLLGCWLGDGHVRDGCITKDDGLFEILASDGHELGVRQKQLDGKSHIATRTVVGLNSDLRAAGLRHNKHIPDAYLRASMGQRLRLLQGLMDTDGTWNTARRTAVFYSCDKELALKAHELLASLGQRPNLAEYEASGFGLKVTAYRVEFTPVGINPFRLPRKAEQAAASTKSTTVASRRVIVSVEPGPDVLTACIAVDAPTSTYLCGREMIPTHNTGSIDYGQGKLAMQLAGYANSLRYDPERPEEREALEVDTEVGLVVHLPAGTATCKVYETDLTVGHQGLLLAEKVREWRRVTRKGLLSDLDLTLDLEAQLAASIRE